MRSLVVRLPNWVGDVIMALPALAHLQQHGVSPLLVGKGWATSLLAGHPWSVQPYPKTLRERVALLRRLRPADGPDAAPDALLFTNSFSSALEARLAGLRAIGHAGDGRRWLLGRALSDDAGTAPGRGDATGPRHESTRFWRLATAVTGSDEASPPLPSLQTTAAARTQAAARLAAAGLADERPFLVMVPFATGRVGGHDKAWPGFGALAQALAARRPELALVALPGPGEEAAARTLLPTATLLEGADLGTYAAVLQRARAVVANDTGPGHMAAALAVPTLSVLGPTDPRRYGARGPRVRYLGGIAADTAAEPAWPEVDTVLEAVHEAVG